MSLPSLQTGRLHRLGDQVEGGPVGGEVGGEAALVAQPGGQALLLQHRLQRVVDLRALAQRLGEGRRADRGDHELLDVDVGVGVRAAVEDVHHRHRQQVRVGAADVPVERQVRAVRGRPGHGERDAEDRVGAELGLVGRAVELEHRLVDQPLVVGLEALDHRGDVLHDGLDRLQHTLADVPLAAVAQLDRLERAGGRATGHRGARERAVVESDLDLHGGVAARVEDLAGADSCDGSHGVCSWWWEEDRQLHPRPTRRRLPGAIAGRTPVATRPSLVERVAPSLVEQVAKQPCRDPTHAPHASGAVGGSGLDFRMTW